MITAQNIEDSKDEVKVIINSKYLGGAILDILDKIQIIVENQEDIFKRLKTLEDKWLSQ